MATPSAYGTVSVPPLSIISSSAAPITTSTLAVTTPKTSTLTTSSTKIPVATTSSIQTTSVQTIQTTLSPYTTPSTSSHSTSTLTKSTTSTLSHSASASVESSTSSLSISSSSSSDITSSTPAISTSPAFVYIQINSNVSARAYTEDEFDQAPFSELCPSHNCFDDCSNTTRLFQAIPSNISHNATTYGMLSDGNNDPTLFGICTNLANISHAATSGTNNSGLENALSYFPDSRTQYNTAENVSTSIATCFAATCDETRDPNSCRNSCSRDAVLSSDTTVNITGVFTCLYVLCSNTCGLPYANKDIFGVGLLISYIVQAALVIAMAIVLTGTACWQTWRAPVKAPRLNTRWRESTTTFLVAQCFFGISASIASFVMHPSSTDPLSGYTLLSVAITCFLPPIFTLMLLHSHGIKSFYSTVLVIFSWLLATILFFILLKNLLGVSQDNDRFDQALNELFGLASCGGSSAMSLCQQTMHTDPLYYLNSFYNHRTIPNVSNISILWAWSTFVLLILVVEHAYSGSESEEPSTHPLADESWISRNRGRLYAAGLLCASILFGLCLGYQARMIEMYNQADVINWKGWDFGQVVAVLFWIPPIVEFVRQALHGKDGDGESEKSTGHKIKRKALPTTAEYRPLAYSPDPSPEIPQKGLGYTPLPPQSGARNLPQSLHWRPPQHWPDP